jgi:hypothetical protein
MDRHRPYPETPSPSTQPPPGWLERLPAALRAAPAGAGRTRVLAIDGQSGVGKSTLALALGARLAAPVVSLEELYGGWDGLEDGIELLRSAVLGPLAQGAAAIVPRYDWLRGEWTAPWELAAAPAELVVEGVGAGAGALAPYLSLLVWLELDPDARRGRALARGDGELYAPHWARWQAQEDAYIARERPRERADFVLSVSTHEDLGR